MSERTKPRWHQLRNVIDSLGEFLFNIVSMMYTRFRLLFIFLIVMGKSFQRFARMEAWFQDGLLRFMVRAPEISKFVCASSMFHSRIGTWLARCRQFKESGSATEKPYGALYGTRSEALALTTDFPEFALCSSSSDIERRPWLGRNRSARYWLISRSRYLLFAEPPLSHIQHSRILLEVCA